jgi:uncharacterized membrane protein
MDPFHIALILSTFLCSVVAGFLLAFTVVVMPGLGTLRDREFIRSFQVIDGVIQNGQALFGIVWIGSILALIGATALGIADPGEPGLLALICATFIYLVGVQLPTFAINIPLNNRLQSLNVDVMDASALQAARGAFEARWNRWNAIRTVLACLVSVVLIGLVAVI